MLKFTIYVEPHNPAANDTAAREAREAAQQDRQFRANERAEDRRMDLLVSLVQSLGPVLAAALNPTVPLAENEDTADEDTAGDAEDVEEDTSDADFQLEVSPWIPDPRQANPPAYVRYFTDNRTIAATVEQNLDGTWRWRAMGYGNTAATREAAQAKADATLRGKPALADVLHAVDPAPQDEAAALRVHAINVGLRQFDAESGHRIYLDGVEVTVESFSTGPHPDIRVNTPDGQTRWFDLTRAHLDQLSPVEWALILPAHEDPEEVTHVLRVNFSENH